MIAIVVLAFSGIALTVVSEGGILNPPHIPLTDLQENINVGDDTIQIFHIGGEAIDLSAINIILSANGKRTEFNSSEFKVKNLDGSNSTDDALMLGDCIVINTTGKEVNLMSGDAIDMFIVHTPSEQVIQKTVLQRVPWERPEWITPYPYGSICDKSGNNNEKFLSTELVGWINDGLETDCHMVKEVTSYEIFTFGIEEYELNVKDPLKNVSLDVVYSSHDNSQKDMILEINVGGPDWIKVADLKGPNKKDTNEKDTNEKDTNEKDTNEKDTNEKDINGKDTNKKDTNEKDTNKKDTNEKDTNEKDTNGKDTNEKDINGKDTNEKDINGKDTNKKDTSKKVTYQETFPITDKVNTVAKIENLKVRFSAIGNSNSDNKDVWIDFVGIHVES